MTVILLFLKDHFDSSVEELEGERLEVQTTRRVIVDTVQARDIKGLNEGSDNGNDRSNQLQLVTDWM